MNTLQLINVLKKNPITSKQFNGVFPCDKLPKNITTAIIANTDSSNKPGQHWCAFFKPKHNLAEYFSSYGDHPTNSYFVKFLKNYSVKSNNKRIQGDFSQTCGQYCCVYLYYRCLGRSMDDFLKLFSTKNFDKNDKKILQLYQKIFNKRRGLKPKKQDGGCKYSQGCAPLKMR